MPQTAQNLPDVLGIKFGPLRNYLGLENIDKNTLYFITDRGVIFRGRTLVTPLNVVEATVSGSGSSQQATLTLTYYGDDPANPVVQNFTVYTKTAIDTLLSVINLSIANHKAAVATYGKLGHVKLSDATDDTTHDQDYGLTHDEAFAATPKAVAKALQDAKDYTDGQISQISQGMTQKGTYGLAADGADETRSLELIPASQGDTYICISTIANAAYHNGQGSATTANLAPGDTIICLQDAVEEDGSITRAARWTIVPNTAQNAVITENSNTVLTDNTLVLGAGQKKVKRLSAGTAGQFLKQGASTPEWSDHVNADHGIGYCVCATPWNERTKEAALKGFQLVEGAIVAVKFDAGVNDAAWLSVEGTHPFPIIFHNSPIVDNIITKGDTATLMYTEKFEWGEEWGEDPPRGAWVVVSIDMPHDVPTQLSAFTNNIQGIGACNTATGNTAKAATITGVTIGKGSVFAIRFAYDVDSSSTLNVNSSGAKNMLHRNAALGAGQILAGDTVTFISDGTSYHLLSIDRPFDTAPTDGSHNLVDSDAVYQAIESAKLKWEEF